MARRYAVLQKKLQELESILNKVFDDSMETTLPYHHLLSEAINQRILFLKNLLSAEVDSHTQSPHHLQPIIQSLAHLETAFHDWADSRSSLPPVNCLHTLSTCSCTYSCFNDEGDGTTSDPASPADNNEDPEEVFRFKFEEETSPTTPKAVPATVVVVDKENESEKDCRFGVVKSNRIMVVVIFVVVVGVVTARFFSGGAFSRPEKGVLIPT